MNRVLSLYDMRWYRSVRGFRHMLMILLLTTLLTASLVVLGYRTSFSALLEVAKYVAILGAVLHFVVVSMLVGLIAHALIVWNKLRVEGKNTSELKQLRQGIVSATAMTGLMFLLAVGAACVPAVMKIIRQIPEFGVVFALMIIALLIHGININRTCRRLTDSVTAAQRAAQRTMAA
ncbi:hypothetical protein [Xanthomonas nasturtii]|uniref:hypothetical protein n=1 Tax=Xanthomonas nasturtii TaxID=1843581 RepID=UPI0020117A95|nr:hypothetical protein [Xanthomonas nasturtii]MCL1528646.1 hypothetical protein [Xanthomonas nasturtii]MCL1536487.1 hypothetical protein [Xanthomonas nasturtii]MCL1545607.1 hypothetical protein [Xanthomonas nasturtii]